MWGFLEGMAEGFLAGAVALIPKKDKKEEYGREPGGGGLLSKLLLFGVAAVIGTIAYKLFGHYVAKLSVIETLALALKVGVIGAIVGVVLTIIWVIWLLMDDER